VVSIPLRLRLHSMIHLDVLEKMKINILLLLVMVLFTSCTKERGGDVEGYFDLIDLVERKGDPQFIEEIRSEEFQKIYYYPYPGDKNRFLVYYLKGESVVGIGWIRADDDSPLKRKISENRVAGGIEPPAPTPPAIRVRSTAVPKKQ